jgi:hypothetical protein
MLAVNAAPFPRGNVGRHKGTFLLSAGVADPLKMTTALSSSHLPSVFAATKDEYDSAKSGSR